MLPGEKTEAETSDYFLRKNTFGSDLNQSLWGRLKFLLLLPLLTMVVVPRQVLGVDVEVVVGVQLPELAVDDVEVLVGEVVGDLVDVVLLLQQRQGLQEVAAAQFHHGDAARPGAVHHVEDPLDDLQFIMSLLKIVRFFCGGANILAIRR